MQKTHFISRDFYYRALLHNLLIQDQIGVSKGQKLQLDLRWRQIGQGNAPLGQKAGSYSFVAVLQGAGESCDHPNFQNDQEPNYSESLTDGDFEAF